MTHAGGQGYHSDKRLIPIMREMLQDKGPAEVAEGEVLLTGLKGPLEEGFRRKVETMASQIPIRP